MEQRVLKLEQDLQLLQRQFTQFKESVEKNNFSNIEIFNKGVIMNSRFGIKSLSADPTTADVGDLAVVSGTLKICTVASTTSPTWTVVGTQT